MRSGRTRRVRAVPVAVVLLLALGACQPGLDTAAPRMQQDERVEVSERPMPESTGGVARVAVPAEPTGGLPVDELDVAGADLMSLWGLPLYRVEAGGLLAPALVESAEVAADGRRVRLSLRAGSWSDGRTVTAHDLRATVDAVRDQPDPRDDLAWLEQVEVVDDATAVLHLRRPTRRWPLLLEATSVLPAHVLEEVDLADLDNPPSVVGGPFRPDEIEPGLRRAFAAHPDGPLGQPALDGLELVVVPSFDAAMGMLGDGELDATVGHLTVRADLRVRELDRMSGFEVSADVLEVAAPVGGTQVGLRIAEDGELAGHPDLRRALYRVIDVERQVEGLRLGRLATDPLADLVPGDGVDPQDDAGPLDGLDATLVVSNEQEALVATARVLEAQMRGAGSRVAVEGEPTPDDVRRAEELDMALVVRRLSPGSALRAVLPAAEHELLEAAEASPTPTGPASVAAWARAAELAWELPLYEVRVTHVWHQRLTGMEPSAGPGAGLTSAARWRLVDDG